MKTINVYLLCSVGLVLLDLFSVVVIDLKPFGMELNMILALGVTYCIKEDSKK